MSKNIGDDPFTFFGIDNSSGIHDLQNAYEDLMKEVEGSNLSEQEKQAKILMIKNAYLAIKSTLQEEGLAIEIHTSRSTLAVHDEPQLIYSLITLDVTNKDLHPVNFRKVICFLVDRSTSMQGDHIQMVRTNIERAIQSLEESDEIAIVTFSDRAEIMVPLMSIRDARRGLLWNLIRTGGSTEIYHGLKTALDLLKTVDARNTTRHLILITDGKTYGDEIACLEISKEAWEHQIPISAFGLGPDWNDRLLDQIASNSGGLTELIISNDDLKICVDEKIKTISEVLIQGLVINYQIPENIQLLHAHLIGNQSSQLTLGERLHLGDLHYYEKLQLLLEFLVAPVEQTEDQINIFTGELSAVDSGDIPVGKRLISLDLPVTQGLTPEYPDPRIISALSTVMLYRLQAKAREEIENERTNDGTRHLQYLATHMLSRGEHQLAHDILHQVRQIRQNEPIDQLIDKRIKYGTRALITHTTENEIKT